MDRRIGLGRGLLIACLSMVFVSAVGLNAYADGDIEAGRSVFRSYCMLCHLDGEDADRKQPRVRLGLDLRGVYGNESPIGLGMMDEERLIQWISNPKDLKPDSVMLRLPLSDKQIRDVVAFLETFPAPDESKGLSIPPLVARQCRFCHDIRPHGITRVGPPLYGVFGRAPGIEGIPFAVWDADALDRWLTNPRAIKAKTSMHYNGLKDAAERGVVIEYLKSLHD